MNNFVLQDVGTENVTLLDDFLCNAQTRDIEFLLGIHVGGHAPRQVLDPYRFLAHFYTTAGLERPGGAVPYEDTWERSGDNNFRGHMFGHYLSALAMGYRGVDCSAIKGQILAKLEICVGELHRCQQAFAERYPERAGYIAPFGDCRLDDIDGLTGGVGEPIAGTVFVPWYNLHKVLAGLLDIHKHVDHVEIKTLALSVARGFGDYFYTVRVSQYTAEHKEKMLRTEYGGMNDAFYELYRVTGVEKYRVCAETFDEVDLFDALAAGQNALVGRHANTQIPKFISALKRYTTLTQNQAYYQALSPQAQAELPKYLVAAQGFFDRVLANYSYITGGNSSDEHFHDPDTLSKTINRDATHETCNTHNMLKLARELFKVTGEHKYADYYENAFINGILSAQHPETGEMMYFHPMGAGYYKLFRHGLFWCCTGTGVESYVKLGDSLYFAGDNALYVNLFFSSTYQDPTRNMALTQCANLPNSGTVSLVVSAIDSSQPVQIPELYVRTPSWSQQSTVRVNGVTTIVEVTGGYMRFESLSAGDSVEIDFSLAVRAEGLTDNPNVLAFRYGPVVLSAGLGQADMNATKPNGIMVLVPKRDPNALDAITVTNGETVAQWRANLPKRLVRMQDSPSEDIQFTLRGTDQDNQLIYSPHYRRYQDRYGLYMRFTDPTAEATNQAEMIAEKQRQLIEAGASAYLDNFDSHAYEAGYNMQEQGTNTGTWSGKSYRQGWGTGNWCSYDLPIVPDTPNYLNTTLAHAQAGRQWDIYLNDVLFETERVVSDGDADAVFYQSTKAIPERFLTGEGVQVNPDGVPCVRVKFVATHNVVGAIYGLSVTQ